MAFVPDGDFVGFDGVLAAGGCTSSAGPVLTEVNTAESMRLCRAINEQLKKYDAANGTCTSIADPEAVCDCNNEVAAAQRYKLIKAAAKETM